jgi:hypothetical protein
MSLKIIALKGNEPIAALHGEVPDLIFLEISRDMIEAGAVNDVLLRLRQLSADRETVLTSRGRLLVCVGGYDGDPRGLPQIAQYGVYLQKLIDAWPYFGWFCALNVDFSDEQLDAISEGTRPDNVFLSILLSNAFTPVAANETAAHGAQNGTTPLDVNRDQLLNNALKLADSIAGLCRRHDIPALVGEQRCDSIAHLLRKRNLL